MDKINQFVITHKEINLKFDDKIKLLVGAINKDKSKYKGYLFDDGIKDNISCKNQSYCELTGLYYIWKNNSADFVSLEHYRRFFSKPIRGLFCKHNVLSTKEQLNLLEKYDILLPKKAKFGKDTIYSYYCKKHFKKDIDNLRNILIKLFPDYLKYFDEAMNCNYMYPFNMFIMRKDILNEYCNFIFSLLFELEKITDISNYDNYQKRIFGFLSERLMNVFVLAHQSLKVKELFVVYTEQSNFKNFCKYFLN